MKLPCEIAGRIEKKGDRDWYSFSAQKGDVYSIEVYGERLGSPVDMYFVLRTEDGKVLWDFDTVREFPAVNGVKANGGALDGPGPVVVGGVLYVMSGYLGSLGGAPASVLLAFTVDGR